MSATTGQIVRWEILKGLPGEGPTPLHFHTGLPTPWAEGFVVRFWNEDETEWVGNFQGRQDWSTKILLWPEAQSIVVLAMDNFYLVDAVKPDSYVTLESFALVDNLMLGDENRLLFVAESTAVHAFDRERRLLWSRRIVNGYDLQLTRCADGVLVVDVERELGGPRREIHISTKDGTALYSTLLLG